MWLGCNMSGTPRRRMRKDCYQLSRMRTALWNDSAFSHPVLIKLICHQDNLSSLVIRNTLSLSYFVGHSLLWCFRGITSSVWVLPSILHCQLYHFHYLHLVVSAFLPSSAVPCMPLPLWSIQTQPIQLGWLAFFKFVVTQVHTLTDLYFFQ